jgi:hypothetical protein
MHAALGIASRRSLIGSDGLRLGDEWSRCVAGVDDPDGLAGRDWQRWLMGMPPAAKTDEP